MLTLDRAGRARSLRPSLAPPAPTAYRARPAAMATSRLSGSGAIDRRPDSARAYERAALAMPAKRHTKRSAPPAGFCAVRACLALGG